MPRRKGKAFHWLLTGLIAVGAIIAAGVVIWWGAIREALLDPSVPYQTYVAPPAPNYADRTAWALLPAEAERPTALDPPADVFFVHPTTFSERQWNAPVNTKRADELLTKMVIPNYAGPFAKVGRLFAPHYRQASVYTLLTLREDAREARAFAYADVALAFRHFLASYNGDRPFIIVGVEQGGVLAERLVREVVAADPALRSRLAAAYLIETAVPSELYPPAGAVPPCQARGQAGCIAAWVGEGYNEQRRTKARLRHAPVWEGPSLTSLNDRPTLCFNPLLGDGSPAAAPAKDNIGAANASGLEWGVRPGFQANQVGAQCVDGVLRITKPRSPSLRPRGSWLENQRVRPHNVFYADIEADALGRVETLVKARAAKRV
jgi:hypothetical protein